MWVAVLLAATAAEVAMASETWVRRDGSLWARVEADGTIRESGSIVGEVEPDGTLRRGGSIIGAIEAGGIIRRDGSIWGRSEPACEDFAARRRLAAVLFFFSGEF